jgi:hypothetical protein
MSFNIAHLPEKKTSLFLIAGVVLYLGSAYLNTLKVDLANLIGLFLGGLLIVISIIAQIKLWYRYLGSHPTR